MILLSLIAIFLLVNCMGSSFAADPEGYFDGSAYAEYLLNDEKVDSNKNTVMLEFRTIQPNGLLLHGKSTGGDYGDYFTIELIGGKLRFATSLGRRQDVDDMRSLTLGDGLADNKFHTVKVEHNGREIWVYLDQRTKDATKRRIETRYEKLTLDVSIFIGGSSDMKQLRDVISKAYFQGCLKGVDVNKKNLLQGIGSVSSVLKTYGVTDKCKDLTGYKPVTLNGRQGEFSIATKSGIEKFTGELWFRTYKASGTTLAMNDRFHLNFTSDSISLVVHLADDVSLRKVFKYSPVNSGMWHHVKFEIGGTILLNVDGMEYTKSASIPQNFFIGSVQIGGDFVGCVWNINFNNELFDPSTLTPSEYMEVGTCHITNFCFPMACKHGGKCSQDGKTFACDCLNTQYHGSVCQFSKFPRTCHEIRHKEPKMITGTYTIDPDGSGPEKPYKTKCSLATEKDWFGNDISRVWTEVETGDRNVPLQKYPSEEGSQPESVIRDVTYKPTFQSAQMVSLSSEYCKQFVEYQCKASRFLNNLDPSYGHWVGSHGKHYYYWGGAGPQHPGKCACGVKGDCLDGKGCNCDARRSSHESDKGYLYGSNGQVLPVSQVLFGDVDSNTGHSANYTVGPLMCYGRPNNTATFSRKEGLISLRRPEGSLDGDSGDVSLFFRTPFSRGILFHQGEIAGDFIQVNITSNDTVQLSYDIGNGPEAIVVKSSSPLNTNRLWHKVVVWFNIKEFGLEIDGVTKAKLNPLQKDSQLDAVGDLFIGGYGGAIQGWMPELLNGFIGCIRGFTINGEVLNLDRLSKDFHYVSAGCNCTNETRCGDVFDTPPYTPDPSSGSTSLPPGPPRGPAARSGGDDDNYTVIIVVVVLLVILLIVAAILVFIWCSRKHRGLYHTHEDEPLAKTNEPFISLQPHGKDAAEPKKEWYI